MPAKFRSPVSSGVLGSPSGPSPRTTVPAMSGWEPGAVSEYVADTSGLKTSPGGTGVAVGVGVHSRHAVDVGVGGQGVGVGESKASARASSNPSGEA